MERIGATILVMMCLASTLRGQQPTVPTDYQRLADEQPWVWKAEQANLLYCAGIRLAVLDTMIEIPRLDLNHLKTRQFTIHIRDRGQEVYSFEAPWQTVFDFDGRVLYFATCEPSSTGSRVWAYDMRAKKELWRTEIRPAEIKTYSAYTNDVTIERENGVVIVRGNESLERYAAYLDMKTGRVLGIRDYPLK